MIIWHTWATQKKIATLSYNEVCGCCRNNVHPQLLKVSNMLTILLFFIIPIIFPTSFKYYAICPECNNVLKELSRAEAQNLLNHYKLNDEDIDYIDEEDRANSVLEEVDVVLTEKECKKVVTKTMQHLPELNAAMLRHKKEYDVEWIELFLSYKENINRLKEKVEKYQNTKFSDDEIKIYFKWYYFNVV